MTPDEHATRAEELLAAAEGDLEQLHVLIDRGEPGDRLGEIYAAIATATQVAQVHATLSLRQPSRHVPYNEDVPYRAAHR
jgi:hypothetical protein